ncbi:MAG: ROK family protein [Saccharofermentanales bacterium]
MRSIGVHCGKTELRGAVTDQNGRILKTARLSSQIDKGILYYLKNIQKLINMLSQPYNSIDHVGIVTSGKIDADTGLVTNTNILGYDGTDLRAVVSAVLQVPVYAGNSTVAALMGEVWTGAAKRNEKAFYLSLSGTVEGASFSGSRDKLESYRLAGELGNVRLYNNNGSHIINDSISSAAIYDRLEKCLGYDINPEDYRDLYKREDPEVRQSMNELAYDLALTAHYIVSIEGAESILIGGELSQYFDLFESSYNVYSKDLNVNIPIYESPLGLNAACLGAIRACMLKFS